MKSYPPSVMLPPPTAQTPSSAVTSKEKKALKESSQDFEAVFIRSLLKEMRKSIPENKLFPKSNAEEMYQEMLDGELASTMAATESLGIAQQVYRQLEQHLNQTKE